MYILAAIVLALILSNIRPKLLTDKELFPKEWVEENVPEEYRDLHDI